MKVKTFDNNGVNSKEELLDKEEYSIFCKALKMLGYEEIKNAE